MATQKRNKIQNVYLNNETHQVLKELAALQGSTIQATAANFLEQNQPALRQLVDALYEIQNGAEVHKVLRNLVGSGLQDLGTNLMSDDEEQEDATNNRESD